MSRGGRFRPNQLTTIKGAGCPGAIAESPEYRTGLATIRVAIPAQVEAVEKLLDPKAMGPPDTAYAGSELSKDARY